VILPDVNVLPYAFRWDSPRHAEYRRWLQALVNAQAAYGIAPQVCDSHQHARAHLRSAKHARRGDQVLPHLASAGYLPGQEDRSPAADGSGRAWSGGSASPDQIRREVQGMAGALQKASKGGKPKGNRAVAQR